MIIWVKIVLVLHAQAHIAQLIEVLVSSPPRPKCAQAIRLLAEVALSLKSMASAGTRY
jgi:hypothetical protein